MRLPARDSVQSAPMVVDALHYEATCVEARRTRDQARAVRDVARAARRESVVALARAAALRGASRISGASDLDAPLIAPLITHASLCIPCIARKAGAPDWRVAESLKAMSGTFTLEGRAGRCDACLGQAVVYRLR